MPQAAGSTIRDSVLAHLDACGCPYEVVEHPPVRTAEEAAAARGTPLAMGAKAIVCKLDDDFRLLALSAARQLRSRLLRRALGVARTRFASHQELLRLTGLEPGCVPPFGPPILPLELLADPSLLAQPRLALTPGDPTCSLILASADWRRAAQPRMVPFAR
ncbi:MAG TPA: YbaK/EbsC family protein [Thermoanaerobaculia bacterium]|nr:YbaK/EbsC family protein [Thermoanaerobaculia bacterium]